MGGFIDARNGELDRLIKDLLRQENAAMAATGSHLIAAIQGATPTHPRFVPCPDNIGNDPCDDQSWDDDEDY